MHEWYISYSKLTKFFLKNLSSWLRLHLYFLFPIYSFNVQIVSKTPWYMNKAHYIFFCQTHAKDLLASYVVFSQWGLSSWDHITTRTWLSQIMHNSADCAQALKLQHRHLHQLIAITRTVHDFQSLTHFSTAQGSSQAQTLQPCGNESRANQKLSRVYQHPTFQWAVSKALVVAVHTMFHSGMLQTRKRSA